VRLAYLDPHAVPDDCPEALQILYTVDALGQRGIEVTLITPPPAAGTEARAILGRGLSSNVELRALAPATPAWLPIRSNRPFYRAAGALLATLGVDAVLVRNLKMAEHLLKRVSQVPLFFETHELFAQSYREEHPRPSLTERRKLRHLTQREDFVYRHARGLIALTALLIEDIRTAYRIDTPAVVAPDGVDLAQAETPASAPPNDTPVLLYLGSLHPWKGVETLIQAMAHVAPPAVLHVVGGNPQRIAQLRALARGLGVEARVAFEGPVPPGRRFEWIQRADVCLLPLTATSIASRYTSPLKLFEYMAAARAIVVADLPAMRAVLRPDSEALLVPSGDPQAFAAAIARLLADAALRARLGAAARARAQEFTWEQRARTVATLVETLTRTASSAARG
jgi:glycosyltransferase involved in cell wall biosynthesis